MIRFEDTKTGSVGATSVVCRLFEIESCRCSHYPERHQLVQDCVRLDADSVSDLSWLPNTCAYRLLDEG
ncbi:MAG TPA: YcgN family cysteine cluster protein, partial [Gammaproteobacteria bacterium]|nr:YcgN family cysteine cluster protein [Gammaproteobacteria bacterium]